MKTFLAETFLSVRLEHQYQISRLVFTKPFFFVVPFFLPYLCHREVFLDPFSQGYGASFHFLGKISFRFSRFFINDGSQCFVDRQGWVARVDQFKRRAFGRVLFAAFANERNVWENLILIFVLLVKKHG